MRILLDWVYSPDKALIPTAQVIIGMAFGANQKGRKQHPGQSNKAIARIIYELWRKRRLPVIAQREVAEALAGLRIPVTPSLVVSEADNQEHIDSHEVLSIAQAYCRARKINRV